MTTTVSVKIPKRVLERMPRVGQGRSGFIVQALEEKLARQTPAPWKPTSKRGRRLAALLERVGTSAGLLWMRRHWSGNWRNAGDDGLEDF